MAGTEPGIAGAPPVTPGEVIEEVGGRWYCRPVMTAPSTVIAPVVLQMQFGLLQVQFPAWQIVLCRCEADSWFEAKRRECAGNCRCVLVADSAARMLDLLTAEAAPAAKGQRAS